MAHPIIIQESTFRNYLENFQEVIRLAQWMYFETVLMGLIHCQASRTLSGMLRTVAVWDLSLFLVSPRWATTRLAEVVIGFTVLKSSRSLQLPMRRNA